MGAPARAFKPKLLPAGAFNLLARGRETFDGGAVEDVAVRGVEAGAVAGAVPGFLLVVEGDDAPQVGADGGALVERAGVVAVEGHFQQATAHDGTRTGGDLVGGSDFAAGQVVGVLRGDVEVLARVLAARA